MTTRCNHVICQHLTNMQLPYLCRKETVNLLSMKRFLFLLPAVITLFSFTVLQSGKDEIIAALKAGNATEFTNNFAPNLDVKLPNSNEMKGVPKAQAASSVKSFFTDNGITSCTVTSQRENGGTMYVTGKLNGNNSYNITAMIKSTGDKFSIITLRINN